MNQKSNQSSLSPLGWAFVAIILTFSAFYCLWWIGYAQGELSVNASSSIAELWLLFCSLPAIVVGGIVFYVARRLELKTTSVDDMERELTHARLDAERNRIEQEQMTALFESMSYNVPGVIFRYEVPGYKQYGQFRYVSRDMVKLCGYSAPKILRDPQLFLQAIHPADKAQFERNQVLATNRKTVWQDQFRLLLKNGVERWVEVRAHLFEDGERPACYDGILIDVTQQRIEQQRLKESEDKARELNTTLQNEVSRTNAAVLKAQKAQETNENLIRTLSHEVRTSVNGVQGMVDMLLSSDLEQEQRDWARQTRESVQVLLPVVSDLIDRNYMNSGHLVIENTPFNIHEVVGDVFSMLNSKAENKGLVFKTVVDDKIPDLLDGDGPRIRQVIYNLLCNAIEYTEQGEVELKLELTGVAGKLSFVRFVITDTGEGFDADTLVANFSSQISAEVNRNSETLGLPLARKLVELMGGKVAAKSEPGNGSEVWFALRLENVSEEYRKATQAPQSSEDYQPLKVLVAEDVVVNQKICRYRLEALGHELKIVENGELALKRLAQERFDAVLMDCEMPVMDGFEATTALRSGDYTVLNPEIYIVAVTAKSLKGDRQYALDSGMNEFVSKPFNQNELERALNRVQDHILKRGESFSLPRKALVGKPSKESDVNVDSKSSRRSGGVDKKQSEGFNKEEISALLSMTSRRAKN